MPETVSPEEQKNAGEWEAPEQGKDEYSEMLAEAQAEPGIVKRALNKLRGKSPEGEEIGEDGLTHEQFKEKMKAEHIEQRADAHEEGNAVNGIYPTKLIDVRGEDEGSAQWERAQAALELVGDEESFAAGLIKLVRETRSTDQAFAEAERARSFLKAEADVYLPPRLAELQKPDKSEYAVDPVPEREMVRSKADSIVQAMREAITTGKGNVEVDDKEVEAANAVMIQAADAKEAAAILKAASLVGAIVAGSGRSEWLTTGAEPSSVNATLNGLTDRVEQSRKPAEARLSLGIGTEMVFVAKPVERRGAGQLWYETIYQAYIVSDGAATEQLAQRHQDDAAAAEVAHRNRDEERYKNETPADKQRRESKSRNRKW